MSWDAWLIDDRGHTEGEWNYTHNTSPMIYAVLDDAGVVLPPSTRECWALPVGPDGRLTHYPDGHGKIAWWEHLSGMDGATGAAFLDVIVRGLEADPERFQAMNPPNGWGHYDQLVKILREMRAAIPEWPTVWEVHG